MKFLKLGLVLIAAAALAGCIYIGDGVGVTLSADRVSLLSGQIATLRADAWSGDGSDLTYEWTEDGVPLDASDDTLYYSKFVTEAKTVSLEVTVQSDNGAIARSSRDFFLSPPASPASLVIVNSSPFDAYYLHLVPTGSASWGLDHMRPASIIPPQGSFVVSGSPAGTWDMMALGNGGWPIWKSPGLSFGPNEVRTVYLQ